MPVRPQSTYQRSWIDALVERIDRTPGPTWLFYTLLLLAFALLNNAVAWADGYLAPGEFSRVRLADAGYLVGVLAVYHHLSGVARTSFRRFRPVLAISDLEAASLEHRLTTLPRTLGWVAILGGVSAAIYSLRTEPSSFELGPEVGAAATTYLYVFVLVPFSALVAVVIQAIRQLRQVSQLHERATDVNLFQLQPVHALATLTSRTGLGLVLFMVFNALAESNNMTSLNLAALIGMGVLAIVVFVVPLQGMRNRLADEKARLLSVTNEALEATIDRIHEQVDANAYDRMDGLSTTLNALVVERDLIRGISTWPWEQGTARGFASTLLIPIVVWLATRLLERFL